MYSFILLRDTLAYRRMGYICTWKLYMWLAQVLNWSSVDLFGLWMSFRPLSYTGLIYQVNLKVLKTCFLHRLGFQIVHSSPLCNLLVLLFSPACASPSNDSQLLAEKPWKSYVHLQKALWTLKQLKVTRLVALPLLYAFFASFSFCRHASEPSFMCFHAEGLTISSMHLKKLFGKLTFRWLLWLWRLTFFLPVAECCCVQHLLWYL